MTTDESRAIVYEYLQQPVRMGREIWRKVLRRDELKASLLPVAITYDGDRVQTTPDDRMSRIMAEVADLDRQIEELRRVRAQSIMTIGKTIDKLEDKTEAAVLEAYYVAGMSVPKIAEHINYSPSHTYAIRRRGIQNIIRIINANDL